MDYLFNFGHGGHFFMFPWGLIVVVIVIALIWRGTGRSRQPSLNDSALVILRERYAKGEINQEEYEAMKKNLVN